METTNINLTINGISVTVPEGTTILDAARRINISIPTLCDHPDLKSAGSCRVCVVEIKGSPILATACSTNVSESMIVYTNSNMVRMARKTTVELLLSEHNADCTKCYRNGNCELQWLASEYRIGDHLFHDLVIEEEKTPDATSTSIIKDDSKCIRCQRCIRTCQDLQDVGTFTLIHSGKKQKVSTFFEKPLKDVFCIGCGQCLMRCPTSALSEKTDYEEVWDILANKELHPVISVAPSVRIAICDDLGINYNKETDAKLTKALKIMGFSSVLNYGLFSDLYILELCTEFLLYLKENYAVSSRKPFIVSCSRGNFDFLNKKIKPNNYVLSNILNAHLIPEKLSGNLLADKKMWNAEQIRTVVATSCTTVKNPVSDVSYLTTRELARMIRQSGIDVGSLKVAEYEESFSLHSGASLLTETSGGVTEAVIRTLYELLTGTSLPEKYKQLTALRGNQSTKQISIRFEDVKTDWEFLEGKEIHFAVVNGSNHFVDFFRDENDVSSFHFVEMMVCKGGCMGGGGQPLPVSSDVVDARNNILFSLDETAVFSKAHENPELQAIYREFLKYPGSDFLKFRTKSE
jgi:iron only hydrogenase large subunit-like protein/ferredoxin